MITLKGYPRISLCGWTSHRLVGGWSQSIGFCPSTVTQCFQIHHVQPGTKKPFQFLREQRQNLEFLLVLQKPIKKKLRGIRPVVQSEKSRPGPTRPRRTEAFQLARCWTKPSSPNSPLFGLWPTRSRREGLRLAEVEPPSLSPRAGLSDMKIQLLKKMVYFPLLVLKSITTGSVCKYIYFSRGLEQMGVNMGSDIWVLKTSHMRRTRCSCFRQDRTRTALAPSHQKERSAYPALCPPNLNRRLETHKSFL